MRPFFSCSEILTRGMQKDSEMIELLKFGRKESVARLWATAILGVIVMIVSVGLMFMTCTRVEERPTTVTRDGNRAKTTAIGTATGAGAGVAIGTGIGGVGVVCCGTGFGIPVGLVCLGIAAVLGVVGGATGYAVGKSATTVTTVEKVSHTAPLVSSWVCWGLFGIGLALVAYSVWRILKVRKSTANDETILCLDCSSDSSRTA